MAYYLDTSAAAKLVMGEDESHALIAWLASDDHHIVSSDLLRTELLRVARRRPPETMRRAREVLDALVLVAMPTAIFEDAGRLDPVEMRSLDALHLAAALELGDDLEGIVTYDDRLATAAASCGVAVVAPTPAEGS